MISVARERSFDLVVFLIVFFGFYQNPAVANGSKHYAVRAIGIGKVVLETRIDLNPRRQTRAAWSWAAITAMITETGETDASQCSILRTHYQVDCCTLPERCNADLDIVRFQKHLTSRGIAVKAMDLRHWRPMVFQNHLSKTQKPIIAKIKSRENSPQGSFVLITGVILTDLGVIMYELYDPTRALSPLKVGEHLEDLDFFLQLETSTVLMVE